MCNDSFFVLLWFWFWFRFCGMARHRRLLLCTKSLNFLVLKKHCGCDIGRLNPARSGPSSEKAGGSETPQRDDTDHHDSKKSDQAASAKAGDDDDAAAAPDNRAQQPGQKELGGPKGPEPTRFGDWERAGRCSDF